MRFSITALPNGRYAVTFDNGQWAPLTEFQVLEVARMWTHHGAERAKKMLAKFNAREVSE